MKIKKIRNGDSGGKAVVVGDLIRNRNVLLRRDLRCEISRLFLVHFLFSYPNQATLLNGSPVKSLSHGLPSPIYKTNEVKL